MRSRGTKQSKKEDVCHSTWKWDWNYEPDEYEQVILWPELTHSLAGGKQDGHTAEDRN